MIRSTLRVVVLLSFFLSACFYSDKPLLTEDDAVTPLPDTFTLVKTDESGKIKTDEKGAADVSEFTRNGKIYLHKNGNIKSTLTAAELDHNAGVFLVQDVMSSQDPQKGEVHLFVTYFVAKILDNIFVEYIPPKPGKTGLDAALKNAGVVYTIDGEKFVFSDKTQLLAAARVYASRLVEGEINRYRIASSKQDIAALQREIEAGRSKEAPPKAASAGAQADGPAQQECDALAASAYDLSRPAGVLGVEFEKIDAPRAEAACRRAVQERPSPRLYAQLGRALDAGHKDADAVASYRVAADQGSPLGQYALGLMYDNGKGIARNAAQAVFWYRKAAEQGYAPGQNNLGAMYNSGDGVARDAAQAVFWYRKAAEQGLAIGQTNLGGMYYNGEGVATDEAQANFWLRKAADQGFAEAQKNLNLIKKYSSQTSSTSHPPPGPGYDPPNWQRFGYGSPRETARIPTRPPVPGPMSGNIFKSRKDITSMPPVVGR